MYIGASSRRKSYTNILQPCLPKPRQTHSRQKDSRTIYQSMPPPAEELKSFRRKLLGSVSSLKINLENSQRKSQNNTKGNVTLATLGSDGDQPRKSDFQVKEFNQYENQNNQNENVTDGNKKQIAEIQEQIQNQQQEHAEMDGYEMGEKAEGEQNSEEQKNKLTPTLKLYTFDRKNNEQEMTSAEHRMQLKLIHAKYQLIRARRQQNEFMKLINEYKSNKIEIKKQMKKKSESMGMLASIKKASLPKINTKKQINNVEQIVIPSFEQIKKNNQIGESEEQKIMIRKRLEKSMSLGKIQIMTKKQKIINHDAHHQQQIDYAIKTQRVLRQKGVKINAITLKSSMVNIREPQIYLSQNNNNFPQPNLMSNPLILKHYPNKKSKV